MGKSNSYVCFFLIIRVINSFRDLYTPSIINLLSEAFNFHTQRIIMDDLMLSCLIFFTLMIMVRILSKTPSKLVKNQARMVFLVYFVRIMDKARARNCVFDLLLIGNVLFYFTLKCFHYLSQSKSICNFSSFLDLKII